LRPRVLVTALVVLAIPGLGPPDVAPGAVWRPLARQKAEPDTLYLFDARRERRLAAGRGGLIAPGMAPGAPTWGPGARVRVVRGRYRAGVESLSRERGYLWMPSVGVIAPSEFTVELWLRCARPWTQAAAQTPLRIGDANDAVDLRLTVDAGRLTVRFRHLQDRRGPVDAQLATVAAIPAGRWANVAVTYRRGLLRLYLNGRRAGTRRGVRAPKVWADSASRDGLSLVGAQGAGGAPDFALSDLRISRLARTPGRAVRPRATSVLTVGRGTSSRRVRRNLLGGLHGFGLRARAAERMGRGAVHALRTDKFLTATPIKAGAPDADHPTPGRSGRFSYDWQVVDRTMRYFRRLGVAPYISIDSTPQILGGSVAPMRGEALRTSRAASSAFAPEVPSDMEAFGTMVADLVHHVIVEKRFRVRYWGVWNEPDLAVFWKGSFADYLRLYDVTARAVKSVDRRLKVGGPEVVGWSPDWIEGLIRHAARQGVPLDFISWHMYDSTVVEIPQMRAQVDRWARIHGLGRRLGLINGEWTWQIANAPGGRAPWGQLDYFRNDWHAAFVGASLIEMQRAGVVYGIYGRLVADRDAKGIPAAALMTPTHPWANLNVFRMWSRMAPRIAPTTYRGRPGVFALASKGRGGEVTVLLSYLRYRKGAAAPLTIRAPGLTGRTRVTHYVVDDRRSNRYDAGPAHTSLETVRAPRPKRGRISVRLRPRSVHLLVFRG
jgi:hypothetical protein